MECEIHKEEIFYKPLTEIKEIDELKNFLPSRPYCCMKNLEHGLKIRPREEALKAKYIQLNVPFAIKFLTFDIDMAFDEELSKEIQRDYRKKKFFCNWQAAFIGDWLAPPTLIAQNRLNGHAHFIYVLTTPVYTTDAAHLKPLQYLEFIRDAYTIELKADVNYKGLISKNPFNKRAWQVSVPSLLPTCSYTLGALASRLPAKYFSEQKPLKRNLAEIAGLGRNCHILATVGNWAYSAIRQYWQNLSAWPVAVYERCEEENLKFSEPLYSKEILSIARSIAKWTVKHITPEGFSEWQREKAKLWAMKYSKKEEGQELLRQGKNNSEISKLLGVSRRTVINWSKGLKLTL